MATGTRRITDRLDFINNPGFAEGSLIRGGTVSVPLNIKTASYPLIGLSSTCALTAGNTVALQSLLTMSAASTSGTVEAFRSVVTADVKTGGWCNAILGKVDYSTSGYAHGIAGVICAELNLPGSAITRGQYFCYEAELEIPASCTGLTNPVGFMVMNAWGTNVANFDTYGYLFKVGGLSVGSGKLFQANTAAAATHALRILIDSTPYYVMLTDTGA